MAPGASGTPSVGRPAMRKTASAAPPTITINAAYPGASAETLAETVAAVEQLISSTTHADPTDELATTLQQLRSRLRMTTDEPSMGAPPMIALQALTAEHNAQTIEEAIAQISDGVRTGRQAEARRLAETGALTDSITR